jgi:hypothetical protein
VLFIEEMPQLRSGGYVIDFGESATTSPSGWG